MQGWKWAATTLALTGATLAGTAGAAWATCEIVDKPASAAVCSIARGGLAGSATDAVAEPVKNTSTGRHACYDRMYVDTAGTDTDTGHHVGYPDAFHHRSGTGYRPLGDTGFGAGSEGQSPLPLGTPVGLPIPVLHSVDRPIGEVAHSA
ncbi:hypothetical protein [Streptomyces qinzhouensis]|uniref:Uncharacterized protein n=1 Tax=Streptomyces qinzhouensis TaxID=2599401 RepID=A0A5B8J1N5_9ACTN|nr:hypothetical protein [Streptomyces qinzhouensis]QDY75655.1 hypothetical protein FQU76_03025 [Streptomyces qinzhouensis]